jgi:hypothetical protein
MGDDLPDVDLGLSTGKIPVAVWKTGGSTCVSISDGSLKCFGGNSQGELGLQNTSNIGDGPGEMGSLLGTMSLGFTMSYER